MSELDPTVRALVQTINDGDRAGFLALLAPGATLSDDGTDRDLRDWIDREIFSANGSLAVESADADGMGMIARYRNDTWGQMSTRWRFRLAGDKIDRIETGQA